MFQVSGVAVSAPDERSVMDSNDSNNNSDGGGLASFGSFGESDGPTGVLASQIAEPGADMLQKALSYLAQGKYSAARDYAADAVREIADANGLSPIFH